MIPFYLRMLALGSMASFAAACFVETSTNDSRGPRRGDPGSYGGGTATPPPAAAGSSKPTPSPASSTPILVDVDTDKTMTAAPGEGVGVFTEYAAGGHWRVSWTCDTKVNPQGPLTCDFLVRAKSISLFNSSSL